MITREGLSTLNRPFGASIGDEAIANLVSNSKKEELWLITYNGTTLIKLQLHPLNLLGLLTVLGHSNSQTDLIERQK